MCTHGTTVDMEVRIRDSAYEVRRVFRPIDFCISSLVFALDSAGIMMEGSCCGHGRNEGEILLEDGRILRIITTGEYV